MISARTSRAQIQGVASDSGRSSSTNGARRATIARQASPHMLIACDDLYKRLSAVTQRVIVRTSTNRHGVLMALDIPIRGVATTWAAISGNLSSITEPILRPS